MNSEWARCRPFIEAALKRALGTHSIEDVEAGIASGEFVLFSGIACAWVVQISPLPQRTVCNVFLGGGEMAELLLMEPIICAWAKAQGCDGITILGRSGWERVGRSRGYRRKAVLVVKEI